MADTVLAATNLALPFSNWTVVAAGLFNGGVFNFTEPQSTNYPAAFSRVVTP